ncbi:MAG: tetratricopeptide repeat protein [Anaerolineae bacterium]|nr:tetratricopeptide repeat protein [Anaerolineae bacterium]
MPYTPLQLANAFIQAGELDDALAALDEHLIAEPEDDVVRRMRASVLLRLASAEYLNRALTDLQQLGDTTSDDWQQQSIIYEKLGDLKNAISRMQQAIALQPNHERYAERLLQLYIANNNLEAALELVRQQARTWRWLQWEGDILVLLGDDMMATARYGLVLALLDELADSAHIAAIRGRILLARAACYMRLGYGDVAREHFLAAQKIYPNDPTIEFNLGVLHFLDGEREVAIDHCRRAYQDANAALQGQMRLTLAEHAITAAFLDEGSA